MQHGWARSHANALNTNENCLDSQAVSLLPSSSLVAFGYNLTLPFWGCEVKVTNHSLVRLPG